MGALVTETPAASPDVALHHFQGMLAFETDCWDVHEGLKSAKPDFILVDVRGPASFANGHVQGAINIPHGQMTASRMPEFRKKNCSWSIAPGRTATGRIKPLCASLGLGYL